MAFENHKQPEMSLEEIESRKELILQEITKLGQTKEALDTTVSNHEGQKTQYADLTKAIENKKAVIALLEPEIKELVDFKNKLDKDCQNLLATIEDKTVIKAEVEKFKNMIKILQEEYATFSANFTERKNKAESTLKATIEKLDFLHASIGTVCNNLK